MRPPVIETDDGDYIKLPPTVGSSYSTVSSKTSGRRNRDLQQRKRVAAERYIHQLPVKSNSNSFSGDISEGKSESYVEKDPQKSQENTGPVSETNHSISFPAEKSVSHKKPSKNSNGKVNGSLELNSGVYLMRSVNMVANLPEKGSPEDYKKRVTSRMLCVVFVETGGSRETVDSSRRCLVNLLRRNFNMDSLGIIGRVQLHGLIYNSGHKIGFFRLPQQQRTLPTSPIHWLQLGCSPIPRAKKHNMPM
ncbi:unnamed protein product [Lactuca saligna]|uniref:Uncharacterized protein n=1 Tax=Lactuca saligna TaxID=75948 RepID=A0AA36DXX8_LACSI|nr:unnamed protein product [Lactuca saligna]